MVLVTVNCRYCWGFWAYCRQGAGRQEVNRIYSDLVGFGRTGFQRGGMVGFGWTRFDWLGLAWTGVNLDRVSSQKSFL